MTPSSPTVGRFKSFLTLPDVHIPAPDVRMGLTSIKPLAFLAHSLGGLLLKEALVRLEKSLDTDFQTLLDRISGVIFGVPNLGMDQAQFRTVVHKNPNYDLVDDIARGSNYLRRLDASF